MRDKLEPPEQIWATRAEKGTGSWNAEPSRMQDHLPIGWQVEYTRADITAELLDALELLLGWQLGIRDDERHVVDTARAAIAKAKGETT